ncbi:MAG: hypothetical protein PF444_07575 [Bacteroidales bacterium]|nr:hypothetical protein [Bacteroidales bacterium]
MKNNTIHILLFKVLLLAFVACEDIIDVPLPEIESKLVIEGEINSGLPAIVNLSYNMDYFAPIDSSSLSNMFITDSNAIVVVSDGVSKDTLTVMPITKFPYTAYVGSIIVGEEGKTYTLNVDYKDKSYHSTTTIPENVAISSIWFEPQISNDSIGMIGFSLFDDGSTNNYYAISSLVIGTQWWYYTPAYGVPVFDDVFFNGDSTIITLPKGYVGNDFYQPEIETNEQWDSIFYFRIGESVSLRLATMDQDFYLWWNAYYRSEFTGSNPYSNPSAILTNIRGDPALGRWGGYANTIANVRITESGSIEDLTIEDLMPLIVPDTTDELE